MSVFSKDHVAKAIAMVPATASSTLRLWIERGTAEGLDDLVSACEAELAARGPSDFSKEQAAVNARLAAETEGLPLEERIFRAFQQIPPNIEEERDLIRILHANPGISNAEATRLYGVDKVALVIGHFIHWRVGAFHGVLPPPPISDLLIERAPSPEGVRYTLRPETVSAWSRLGIV